LKPDLLVKKLRVEADKLGFDALRILRADDARDQTKRLSQWLAAGSAGDMNWMVETAQRRAHPAHLWPAVRAIIVLAMNYGPQEDPRALRATPDKGAISVYARHRDYHDIVKGKLKLLAAQLVKLGGGEVKVFVDTAPVMEKPLAQQAGLGWQGKHTNLVSRQFGSWLFLGSIFSTLDLPADAPMRDHCGACHACLDACPTQAFPQPYVIDARRCVSYLTIEHKGAIPEKMRALIGNRIYGCDDCLAACPWNKFAQTAREAKLAARDDLRAPDLASFLQMDEPQFREKFSGSPIKRIGHERFLRNVLIAAGNSGALELRPLVAAHLQSASPMLREVAAWAINEMDDK
jgi:epoxyqueuosine reductase